MADTGIEIDGRLADTTVPEPAGPPPCTGRPSGTSTPGRWIHWDPWLTRPGNRVYRTASS